jgi:hypothetical protein
LILIAVAGSAAKALSPEIEKEVMSETSTNEAVFPVWQPTETERLFLEYATLPQAPPMEYWIRLAQCETNQNWQNSGRHGGGLGFFTVGEFPSVQMGGWERMGGEEFAGHPKNATPTEQIIVATRTALLGYGPIPLKRDPEIAKRKGIPIDYAWETNPHGYWTWGCAKRVVGDPCGFLYDGSRIAVLSHTRPDYCRFMKPIDYRKVDGNGRYVHNRLTREAIEKSVASGATSVALPSAVAWLYPPAVSTAAIPTDALCPGLWQDARKAGFSDEEIEVLETIAKQESNCRENAKVKRPNGDILRGFTLLGPEWTRYLRDAAILYSPQDLLRAEVHLEAVRSIYLTEVRRTGWGWQPWGLTPPTD